MAEKYKVTGMSCTACSARVERAVSALDGVSSCSVSLLSGVLAVEGDVTEEEIISAVKRAGYGILRDADGEEGGVRRFMTVRLITSLLASVLIFYLSMGHMIGLTPPGFIRENPVLNASIQGVLALFVMLINLGFFIRGAHSAVKGSPNMDTLVSLGSFVSFAYSVYIFILMILSTEGRSDLLHSLYFESAAMILAFVGIGKTLEARAKSRTARAIDKLIELAPTTATVIIDGEEKQIPTSELRVGDLFAVYPGARIPADGIVVSGSSDIDEAALTGESVPVEKTVGSPVYTASVNKTGYLVCRATSVGEGTVLSGIINTVRDASLTKAPIAKMADRVSGVFVPVVLALSLLTFFGWLVFNGNLTDAVSHAISVLVISCPCALGLATPVAITVGGGVGASHGVLFKNASALEGAGRVSIVVLDKTGTVTKGELSVEECSVLSDELINLAYSLEKRSEHPIAAAIVRYCEGMGASELPIEDFKLLGGRGVYGKYNDRELFLVSLSHARTLSELDAEMSEKCDGFLQHGMTPTLLIDNGRCIGAFALRDTPKDDAKEGVEYLKKLGMRIVMLTGDNERVARAIADEVGIDEVIAEVLPEKKERVVADLRSGGAVAMVGDGINDAPTLARADVGIAIGRGTDIAIDSADAVLLSGGVTGIAKSFDIGRATLRNIKENLLWAFLYNCIGIPFAAGLFGLELPPMFGSFAMSLSSLFVVMNALRLGLWRPKAKNAGKDGGVSEKDGGFDEKTAVSAIEGEPSFGIKNKNGTTFKKTEEKLKMKKEFKVTGMMCPHCEARVKSALEAIDGVTLATPSHKKKTVVLELSCDVPDEKIIDTVVSLGYSVK